VIINMADRMKDAEDLKLESLFASDTIADDGFSTRIEKRIRRQLWVRRLALPVALLIGGAIAVKPLSNLLTALFRFVSVLPDNVSSNFGAVSSIDLPQMSTLMMGGMLVLVAVMITRMLED
jgi:hypothetical protein